ncbi:MarR family transcriptional regulator [Blastopirellula sp. J2-11]|uniref:MarR family winged helix-turn-helix transcriptional regulator n=1 Tax=Blastopirellula sp. J2-11 TaxID=2943192 RepID=UPI0021C8E199|nr:MarR family transcriptional regulator [Blastopirellula sp. J2-11]UUO05368.1 MarR family transcriptional regulator [Blastopirellula sp. J2-11]
MGVHDPLEDQIAFALRRIMRSIDLQSRQLLHEIGLTFPQLAALQAIHRLQPTTVGKVASSIHLGHATLTGILDRLEKRELIARQRSENDRRHIRVQMTDAGQKLLDKAPTLLHRPFQRQLDRLESWERMQVAATLQRVATMMENSGGSSSKVVDLQSIKPPESNPFPVEMDSARRLQSNEGLNRERRNDSSTSP